MIGETSAISQLSGMDGNQHIIALGHAGAGAVLEIGADASIETTYDLGAGLRDALEISNASVTVIQHGAAGGSTYTLFVGTDRGLMTVETASARDEAVAEWQFFFTTESTPIATSIRPVNFTVFHSASSDNPAEVRDMALDGPSE
jgi:hypothetical protein